MKQPAVAGLVLASLFLSTSSTALAAQSAEGCKAAKLKETGKAVVAILKCHASATKTGKPVDPVCVNDAETRFSVAFVRIESKGGCSPAGDALDYEDAIDAFVADITGQALCATKTTGAANAAKGSLKCHAKATKKSVAVDAACLAAADAGLLKAFDKGDAKGCTPSGGAATAQGAVATLVTTVAGAAGPTELRLFVADSLVTGAAGDRATTNALCTSSATTQGLTCATGVVSLLSYTGDAIADFPTSLGLATGVPIVAGAAPATIADDWADFLDGSWDTCLGSTCDPAGPAPAGLLSLGTARNGSNADGTTATLNCANWTSTVDASFSVRASCYGTAGSSCDAGATLDASPGFNCTVALPMLCLCY